MDYFNNNYLYFTFIDFNFKDLCHILQEPIKVIIIIEIIIINTIIIIILVVLVITNSLHQ